MRYGTEKEHSTAEQYRCCRSGEINTLLKPEQNEKIVAAMELGKQFAKDFAFFHPFDEPHDVEYDADLLKALIVVQQLGKLYEPKCMK